MAKTFDAHPSHAARPKPTPETFRKRRLIAAGLSGALALALGAGAINRGLDSIPKGPTDERIDEAQNQEKALIEGLINSGQTEFTIGDTTISSFTGDILVTQLPPLTNSQKVVPIHLRETPKQLDDSIRPYLESNIALDVGKPGDKNEQLAKANQVTFTNGLIIKRANGDMYVGGILPDSEGNVPKLETLDDVIDHTGWSAIGQITADGKYSGATVTEIPATGAGGFGADAIDFAGGQLLGHASQTPYAVVQFDHTMK